MSSPLKIGTVTLGRIPRVVAVWAHAEPGVQGLPLAGMDLWEARVDLWGEFQLARARRQIGVLRATLPVIVTIRTKAEGGQCKVPSSELARRYEALLDLADAVDVEMRERAVVRALRRLCEAQRKTLILSHHDFEGTPPARSLRTRIREAESLGADVVKLATMLQSRADMLRLAEVQAAHPRPNLATMGMGEGATLSRLLLASLGSVLVYGAFERAVAPGQVPVREIADLLRLATPAPTNPRPKLSKAA